MDITPSHIELLRTTFDAVKGISPSGSAYKNLVAFLDNLSQSSLKKLSNARIKFVSPLAKNRLNKNEMLNKPNHIRNVASIPQNNWDGEHEFNNPDVEEDKIPGGLAKGMSLNDIAKKHNVDIEVLKKEFVKGVKTEMEHTTDKEVAKEIALDHIFEDPKYYTKLATIEEDWSDKYKRSIDCNNPKGFSQKAHCQGRKKQENKMSETIQEKLSMFFEKNTPTDPSKWAYYKAQAKKKFDVYPSAYANGWAAKQYKAAGGGWRASKSESVNEAILLENPFLTAAVTTALSQQTVTNPKTKNRVKLSTAVKSKDPRVSRPAKVKAKSIIQRLKDRFMKKDESLNEACWVGYKQVGLKDKNGKKVPNCVKEITELYYEENGKGYGYTFEYIRENDLNEAEYQGRDVKLGKPMQGDVKKFKVYVKNPKGNVVKVNFGQGGDAKGGTMRIRKSNPEARKNFRARHNCDNPGPRHKARYWSCRKW